MQFSLARFLSSPSTTFQGDCFVSVYENILSLAIEYSTHLSRDSTSIGLIFHRFVGSCILSWKRFSCSWSLTENQYFKRIVPDLISILSNSGQERRNSSYSSLVQYPITFSTPARLYQLLSKSAISPPAGSWETYLWKYHCDFSFSVGTPRATIRQILGFRHPAIVLIT